MGKLASEDHNDRHSSNPTVVDDSVDDLAKGLASGTLSRRKALRMLGAALVGTTLASIPGAAWAACRPLLHKCTGNFQCCSRNCIKNPQGNGRICGCPSGKTLCGGNKCVSCPAPRVLDTTTCACECPAPTPTYCAATNTCVNTQTDAANCGGCGNACAQGMGCVSGKCVNICPVAACCCRCGYFNAELNPRFMYACSITMTATTPSECQQTCESATPPGYGLTGVQHSCKPPDSNYTPVCYEDVNQLGEPRTTCLHVECTPPAT